MDDTLPSAKHHATSTWRGTLGFDDVSLPTFNAVHSRYRTLLLDRACSVDLYKVWKLDEALNAAREELADAIKHRVHLAVLRSFIAFIP